MGSARIQHPGRDNGLIRQAMALGHCAVAEGSLARGIFRHRMAVTHELVCLTLDLKQDPQLIAEYKQPHQNVWPEIEQSHRDAGIENLEIYLFSNRMFIILDSSISVTMRYATQILRASEQRLKKSMVLATIC